MGQWTDLQRREDHPPRPRRWYPTALDCVSPVIAPHRSLTGSQTSVTWSQSRSPFINSRRPYNTIFCGRCRRSAASNESFCPYAKCVHYIQDMFGLYGTWYSAFTRTFLHFLQKCITELRVCSNNNYRHLWGYVIVTVCQFVCLLVCQWTGLREKFWSDLHASCRICGFCGLLLLEELKFWGSFYSKWPNCSHFNFPL